MMVSLNRCEGSAESAALCALTVRKRLLTAAAGAAWSSLACAASVLAGVLGGVKLASDAAAAIAASRRCAACRSASAAASSRRGVSWRAVGPMPAARALADATAPEPAEK